MVQEMVMQMLRQNPMFQRAEKMAEGKNEEQLKQTAQNLCNNMGINMDDALRQFNAQMPGILQNMMGGKN